MPLTGVVVRVFDPRRPRWLTIDIDLSEIIIALSAIATVLVGLMIVVITVGRLEEDLRRTSNQADVLPRVRLRRAREARLRAAWLLLLTGAYILLGLTLLMFVEDQPAPPDPGPPEIMPADSFALGALRVAIPGVRFGPPLTRGQSMNILRLKRRVEKHNTLTRIEVATAAEHQ
ncbi:MAG: hypothetical protein ACOX9R_04235 [Armatimonadota bacterium]